MENAPRPAFRAIPASDALRPWVAGYSIIETAAGGPPQAILPGLEPVLGFQYRGRVLSLRQTGEAFLETSGITGIQAEVRHYRYMPDTDTLLVRFHPWGASAFLAAPMRDLADRSIGLRCLLPAAAVDEAEARLAEAGSDGERIRIIEAFLLSRLRGRTPDGMVRKAARLLQSGQGGNVGQIAARLGVGERQLERKFQEWVGIGPKRFARLARFQSWIHACESADPLGPVPIPEAGYFDQAHFIKDFRAFTGTTPAAWLRARPRPA